MRHAREALNHFKVKSSMAETALDVISRCLATSTSSGVGGGGKGCCSAATKDDTCQHKQ